MDTENDSSTTDSPNADSDDKDFNIRDLASSSDDTSVESEYFESFPDILPKECNISSTSLAESLKLQRNNYSYHDKKLHCKFCSEDISSRNFVRHLIRKHNNEKEVKDVLAFPLKSKERKLALNLLRGSTNYI